MESKKTTPSGFDEAGASFQRHDGRGSAASPSISESIARGKDAVGAAAKDAMDSGVQSLNAAKDTAVNFVSQTGGEAAKSARDLASNVAGQVGDVAGDLAERGANAASAATAQARSLGAELEILVRRNPLGAIAGAFAFGAFLAMLGRRH